MTNTETRDYFISYTRADRHWAEWIAWLIEAEGESVIIDTWDFGAGKNFVEEMDRAARTARRTIAVLSPHYLAAGFTLAEWGAAYSADPRGESQKLVPVRVAPFDGGGLLGQIVYIDLVGLDESGARERLMSKLKVGRTKPTDQPAFPGASGSSSKPPPFPNALPPYWNIPARNLLFTGRTAVLDKLYAALRGKGPVALSGMPGVGKTQTATEFAHRHSGDYRAGFWVNADTAETLATGLAGLAHVLDLPQKDQPDQAVVVAAVRRWLQVNPGWLLILDNADDLAVVRNALPTGSPGQILLTTRARATRPLAQPIEVDEMSPEDGACFLLRRAGRLAPDAPLDAEADDRTAALALSREVGGLPLALDQAGAYIEEAETSPGEFLDLYQTRGKDLRRHRSHLGERESVTITLSLAFEKVAALSPAAADLLRFCAFLAPDAIPESILTADAIALDEPLGSTVADPLTLDSTLRAAFRYSLLEREPTSHTLTIHRLVQAVLRDGMDDDTQARWAERAVRAVYLTFPVVEFSNWHLCDQILPHATICAGHIEHWNLNFLQAGRLLNQTAYYLWLRARYMEAELLIRRALEITERALGPDHPDTAQSLNNLALLLQAQGKLSESEPLYLRALEITERELGPDHPDTAQSLNNLAHLLQAQGKLSESEPLYLRALAIFERALGSEHPNLATVLENCATLLAQTHQLDEAEAMSVRARAIREKET